MVWNEIDQAFKGVGFKGKADSINNFISTWWGWDGEGDKWTDYDGPECSTNADSVTNWGRKTLRTMSKWLGPTGAPYNGDTLAAAISDRILDISKHGVPIVSLETNLSTLLVQVGDIVRIQSSTLKSIEEYREWQRVNDPTNSLIFYKDTGRYSIPYLVYGCSQCVDKKWFVIKKQVDFNKATIKWDLARAREAPLTKDIDTDLEFTPGWGSQYVVDSDTVLIQIQVHLFF